MRLEIPPQYRYLLDVTERAELRDFQILEAAGIDSRKWLEIHSDIDRDPVIRAIAPDAQSDGCQLRIPDVDTRGITATECFNAVGFYRIDNGSFQRLNKTAHREFSALEID